MADKEERIFVFTTIKYTIKETTEDGVIVDGFIEPRDKAKMYTRQEAIEVMAKAICREDNCLDSCAECILGFGSTAEEKEQFCQKHIMMSRDLSASYVSRAEAALNALLKGV